MASFQPQNPIQDSNAQAIWRQSQYVLPSLQSFDPRTSNQGAYAHQPFQKPHNPVNLVVSSVGHIYPGNVEHVTAANPISGHFSGQRIPQGPNVQANEKHFMVPNSNVINYPTYDGVKGVPGTKPVTPVVPHSVPKSQILDQQHLNLNAHGVGGISNVSKLQQSSQKTKLAGESHTAIVKVPEPTQVKINKEIRKCIALLKISISETFISWNKSEKTILDLNFMRHLFSISNVDLIFPDDVTFENGICQSLKQIMKNQLLSDWIILKCEEKQIPFFKVSNDVMIFVVHNFSTLLSIIATESCLPLPFIAKDEAGNMQYFYINFPRKTNDKVKKLNVPVFHDVDNGRKKLTCKYPGIRLDCSFESAIQLLTFHVDQSALATYEAYLPYIRQLLIYKHIVWGFLQVWIRKMREHCNGCFKIHEIAQNISLCQEGSSEKEKTEEDQEMFYHIGYMQLYLKFDPVNLKDRKATFSIDNFETNFVCDAPIVQYYRQFFLINDMHYSDTLKNIILFTEKTEKIVESADQGVKECMPDATGEGPFTTSNCSSQIQEPITGKTSQGNSLNTKHGPVSDSKKAQTSARKTLASNVPSGLADPPIKPFSTQATPSCSSFSQEVGLPPPGAGNPKPKLDSVGIPPGTSQESVPRPRARLDKPLLKTRTVEEINSSVNLQKMLDVGEITFDSCFNVSGLRFGSNELHIPTYVKEALSHCYVKHMAESRDADVSHDPLVMQNIFNQSVVKALKKNTLEEFLEAIYTNLQLHFTNATSQKIMNLLSYPVVVKKFPNLSAEQKEGNKNEKIVGGNTEKPVLQTTGKGVIEKSSPVQVLVRGVGPNRYVTLPAKLQVSQEPQGCASNMYPTNVIVGPDGSVTVPLAVQKPLVPPSAAVKPVPAQGVPFKAFVSTNPPANIILNTNVGTVVGTITSVSSVTAVTYSSVSKESASENPIPQKPAHSLSAVTRDYSRQRQTNQQPSIGQPSSTANSTSSESPNGINPVNVGKPSAVTRPLCVSSTSPPNIVVSEPNNTFGRLAFTPTCEESCEPRQKGEFITVEPRKNGSSEKQNENQMEQIRGEQSSINESRVRKFVLKPCSVILKRLSPTDLQRKSVSTGKEKLKADDPTKDSLNMSRKKRISELQFLEAKTRVLEKLRRRTGMSNWRDLDNYMSITNFLGFPDEGRKGAEEDFPSESTPRTNELPENVADENPQVPLPPPAPPIEERPSALAEDRRLVSEKNDTDELLRNECLKRKARVLLVRLEDTPEFKKLKVNVKKEDVSGSQPECEKNSLPAAEDMSQKMNLPTEKRKYFDLRDGNLYLKDQYQVVNGVIVLKENYDSARTEETTEMGATPILDNLFPVYIKSESFVE